MREQHSLKNYYLFNGIYVKASGQSAFSQQENVMKQRFKDVVITFF